MPVKKTTTAKTAENTRRKTEQKSEKPVEQRKTAIAEICANAEEHRGNCISEALKNLEEQRNLYKTVPVEAQEYGSDGQPRPKLSWLLDALEALVGLRGTHWNVQYSNEEVIDAGGGEKLCSVKAVISERKADNDNYVGIGYGCSTLVERVNAQTYKKHLDAWDVAQEKALAAAARFFSIGLGMEPLPEDLNKNLPPASALEPEPNAAPAPGNSKSNEKEAALADLRAAVKKFGYGSVILKIAQYKYGTDKVETLPPTLLRDLQENMVIYRQEWQEAANKEAAAHGDHKRADT